MKTFEVEFTDARVRKIEADGVRWRRSVVEFYFVPDWSSGRRHRTVMFNRDLVVAVRLRDSAESVPVPEAP